MLNYYYVKLHKLWIITYNYPPGLLQLLLLLMPRSSHTSLSRIRFDDGKRRWWTRMGENGVDSTAHSLSLKDRQWLHHIGNDNSFIRLTTIITFHRLHVWCMECCGFRFLKLYNWVGISWIHVRHSPHLVRRPVSKKCRT